MLFSVSESIIFIRGCGAASHFVLDVSLKERNHMYSVLTLASIVLAAAPSPDLDLKPSPAVPIVDIGTGAKIVGPVTIRQENGKVYLYVPAGSTIGQTK